MPSDSELHWTATMHDSRQRVGDRRACSGFTSAVYRKQHDTGHLHTRGADGSERRRRVDRYMTVPTAKRVLRGSRAIVQWFRDHCIPLDGTLKITHTGRL